MSVDVKRYARQMQLSDVGEQGQEALSHATVLCVGAGGLAASLLTTLAASGVGEIICFDDDTVALSNLARQTLFREADVGQAKVDVAGDRLMALNPDLAWVGIQEKFSSDNAKAWGVQSDIIIDAADSFEATYFINDVCQTLKKPWVWASILEHRAQWAFFEGTSACFRCLFESPPMQRTCEQAGVLSSVPAIVGALQANVVMQYLLNEAHVPKGRCFAFDFQHYEFKSYQFPKEQTCVFCEDPFFEREECVMLPETVSVSELKEWMQKPKDTWCLVDVREPAEYAEQNLGGLLIPLGQLTERLSDIPKDKPVILHCRSGGRSGQALAYLKSQGYTKAQHLEGGILAFNEACD